MATSPQFKQKRSAIPGKAPTPADLVDGQIALNTTDGSLYTLKDGSVYRMNSSTSYIYTSATPLTVSVGQAVSLTPAGALIPVVALTTSDVAPSRRIFGVVSKVHTSTVCEISFSGVITLPGLTFNVGDALFVGITGYPTSSFVTTGYRLQSVGTAVGGNSIRLNFSESGSLSSSTAVTNGDGSFSPPPGPLNPVDMAQLESIFAKATQLGISSIGAPGDEFIPLSAGISSIALFSPKDELPLMVANLEDNGDVYLLAPMTDGERISYRISIVQDWKSRRLNASVQVTDKEYRGPAGMMSSDEYIRHIYTPSQSAMIAEIYKITTPGGVTTHTFNRHELILHPGSFKANDQTSISLGTNLRTYAASAFRNYFTATSTATALANDVAMKMLRMCPPTAIKHQQAGVFLLTPIPVRQGKDFQYGGECPSVDIYTVNQVDGTLSPFNPSWFKSGQPVSFVGTGGSSANPDRNPARLAVYSPSDANSVAPARIPLRTNYWPMFHDKNSTNNDLATDYHGTPIGSREFNAYVVTDDSAVSMPAATYNGSQTYPNTYTIQAYLSKRVVDYIQVGDSPRYQEDPTVTDICFMYKMPVVFSSPGHGIQATGILHFRVACTAPLEPSQGILDHASATVGSLLDVSGGGLAAARIDPLWSESNLKVARGTLSKSSELSGLTPTVGQFSVTRATTDENSNPLPTPLITVTAVSAYGNEFNSSYSQTETQQFLLADSSIMTLRTSADGVLDGAFSFSNYSNVVLSPPIVEEPIQTGARKQYALIPTVRLSSGALSYGQRNALTFNVKKKPVGVLNVDDLAITTNNGILFFPIGSGISNAGKMWNGQCKFSTLDPNTETFTSGGFNSIVGGLSSSKRIAPAAESTTVAIDSESTNLNKLRSKPNLYLSSVGQNLNSLTFYKTTDTGVDPLMSTIGYKTMSIDTSGQPTLVVGSKKMSVSPSFWTAIQTDIISKSDEAGETDDTADISTLTKKVVCIHLDCSGDSSVGPYTGVVKMYYRNKTPGAVGYYDKYYAYTALFSVTVDPGDPDMEIITDVSRTGGVANLKQISNGSSEPHYRLDNLITVEHTNPGDSGIKELVSLTTKPLGITIQFDKLVARKIDSHVISSTLSIEATPPLGQTTFNNSSLQLFANSGIAKGTIGFLNKNAGEDIFFPLLVTTSWASPSATSITLGGTGAVDQSNMSRLSTVRVSNSFTLYVTAPIETLLAGKYSKAYPTAQSSNSIAVSLEELSGLSTPELQNQTIYVYMNYDSTHGATLSASLVEVPETMSRAYIGNVTTDSVGIVSDTLKPVYRLLTYRLSATPMGSSIPVSGGLPSSPVTSIWNMDTTP